MDQTRSALLPNIVSYLKKFSGKTISSCQLVLRAYKNYSYTLTDGFFFIETQGLPALEQNTFIRIKQWKLALTVENLYLSVIDWELLGTETMSDFQIKPIKAELQVKALMIPAFRIQLRHGIQETPMSEIFELVKASTSLAN